MADPVRVRVYHSYYGCETGCCGHVVEITTADGEEKTRFEFDHPYDRQSMSSPSAREESRQEWARKFAEETIRDRWPECIDSIDWDSMQIEVSDNWEQCHE
jgi:hypothetical protein